MRYLVTGAAGYLGRALTKRLVRDGHTVVALSRNEGELMRLKKDFPSVEIVPGDIADPYFCDRAAEGVDGIFHLAAFKHVGLAEKNSRECVKSNIYGSMNILDAARKHQPNFIIGISTDKAAQVRGVYGATKFLMEALFREYQAANTETRHLLVRYGNVLDSTGSVTTIWRDKLKRGEEVVITDPDATRFYWTVDQAVDLIFKCLAEATDCTPHKAPMKAMRLGDLLEAMKMKYSKDGTCKMKIVGLQPGENMHETIDGGVNSSQVERYMLDEIIDLV